MNQSTALLLIITAAVIVWSVIVYYVARVIVGIYDKADRIESQQDQDDYFGL